MTKIQHHPSSEQLTAFAAASLPLSQGLAISSHLEYCAECRRDLERLERLGGELFEALKPLEPSEALRSKVFAQLDEAPQGEQLGERVAETGEAMVNSAASLAANKDIPRCLHQFIPRTYQDLDWRRVSPSIESAELCRDGNGAKVELLRIKPGGSAATHTHLGDEHTVILTGSFSDEDGLYGTGSFITRNSRHKHTPVATQDGECICLAITEAPIQFTGFFSRWLNPLMRRSHL